MACYKHFSKRDLFRQLTAFIALVFISASTPADLILTSPPRESAAKGLLQYGPIADRLSEVLGEKVIYQHPKGWLFYQRDMRADKYDIIFDGPHFISWRIRQFGHTPVAKLPGKLVFFVITAKDQTHINSLDDLVNHPVCGIAPPNLATLSILAEYKNPSRQMKLVTPKGGMPGVYKAFKEGKCEAVILRDKFFSKQVPQQERDGLKSVFKSAALTNQGISVSSRVSAEQQALIAAALTEVTDATAPTLKRFAPAAASMVPASKEDYADQYKLLTGVIFGWEITNKEGMEAP